MCIWPVGEGAYLTRREKGDLRRAVNGEGRDRVFLRSIIMAINFKLVGCGGRE